MSKTDLYIGALSLGDWVKSFEYSDLPFYHDTLRIKFRRFARSAFWRDLQALEKDNFSTIRPKLPVYFKSENTTFTWGDCSLSYIPGGLQLEMRRKWVVGVDMADGAWVPLGGTVFQPLYNALGVPRHLLGEFIEDDNA